MTHQRRLLLWHWLKEPPASVRIKCHYEKPLTDAGGGGGRRAELLGILPSYISLPCTKRIPVRADTTRGQCFASHPTWGYSFPPLKDWTCGNTHTMAMRTNHSAIETSVPHLVLTKAVWGFSQNSPTHQVSVVGYLTGHFHKTTRPTTRGLFGNKWRRKGTSGLTFYEVEDNKAPVVVWDSEACRFHSGRRRKRSQPLYIMHFSALYLIPRRKGSFTYKEKKNPKGFSFRIEPTIKC